ncbi:TPA: protein NinF [Escherichia coli]
MLSPSQSLQYQKAAR